jgi:hypothetical protein
VHVVAALLAGLTVAWATGSGIYLGEFAHGGYIWVRNLLNGILCALVLSTIGVFGAGSRVLPSASAHRTRIRARLFPISEFVLFVLVVRWLSFQTGLALHHPPHGIWEFFTAVP